MGDDDGFTKKGFTICSRRNTKKLIQVCIVAPIVSVATIFIIVLFDSPVFDPYRKHGAKRFSIESWLITIGIYIFVLCLAVFCGWLLRRFIRNLWRCPQCHMLLPMEKLNIGKLTSSMNRLKGDPARKMEEADLLPDIPHSCPYCGTVLITAALVERERTSARKLAYVSLILTLSALCIISAVTLWLLGGL